MKLTTTQIDYIAKYLTASNVGTMTDYLKNKPCDTKKYIDEYWSLAYQNHAEEGISLKPEYNDFAKELKNAKKVQYWIDVMKKLFGDDVLERLA